MRMRYKGFTFIEILIVLVVLIVLAAILFPVLVSRRHPPRHRSHCAANEKQIGLGLHQYRQDYDERLPPRGNWVEMAYPYIKSTQIFRCSYERSHSSENKPGIVTSYFINRNLAGAEITSKMPEASIILLGEGEAATGDYACKSFTSCVGFNEKGPVGPVPLEALTRHDGSANYGFLDGHVKWLEPDRFMTTPSTKYGFDLR